ncbi:MAG TPA: hypothetical protein VMK12_14015, partial [Anaeromyxobacteraceae bacterium]|nr:hypothetical protein [Anaeromyxobacteraceae bacterium]
DYDPHAKRVESLADATVGAVQGAQLAGRTWPGAKELDAKHAIKQASWKGGGGAARANGPDG